MSKTAKVLLAYVAGQVTQIVIHAMCLTNNMYSYRQIPFCLAAGFVLFFAIVSGVWIANAKEKTEPAHEKKSYLDYAEIPEDDEMVVNLFDKK